MNTYQIWHPHIADLRSYTGYSSNLAPTHHSFGVLCWIFIKSGTRELQIWCLFLDILQIWLLRGTDFLSILYTHQIWHPRIAKLVFYSGYSSNLVPAHCRSGVLFWIFIKSGTHALQISCLNLDTNQISNCTM